MSNPKIETYLDLVNAITDLFNEYDASTLISEEEIDANLREVGYDPEQVETKMRDVAQLALESSPYRTGS